MQKAEEESLCKVLTDHPATKAKKKEWKYGYDKEYDLVIISKDGTLGDVVEIENLVIGLPAQPKDVYKKSPNSKEQYWEASEYPKELKDIKTIFHWNEKPDAFKAKWTPFIDSEFDKREFGHWFYNNGTPTYISGSNYMYLQWTVIDVGHPDYRESNRVLWLFWEACKADDRCYGMEYLKNRRSGFSFMSSSETVNIATVTADARFGILSKTGPDAKKMFTDKVVPISTKYPFFFKPIQDGMDKPKTELAYRVPASKLTRKSIELTNNVEKLEGLDTSIDWKNTGDNSYDGEKLKLIIQDECYHPDTLIMNSEMDFVKVYDLFVGDEVIIEGGATKRIVKKTYGSTDSYLIKQPYGIDYIVTENHRLVLNDYNKGEVIITAKEFFNASKFRKKHLTRITSKGIQSKDIFDGMPPYLLGLWLGDGRKGSMSIIINQDEEPEIFQYLSLFCQVNKLDFYIKTRDECVAHVVEFRIKNFTEELKKIGVRNNKHVPEQYMKSSIETRLQVLAGLIDTDGYSDKKKGCIAVGMSKQMIVNQIRLLALSCGLSASNVRHSISNYNTDVYKVSISGDLSIIPILSAKKSFKNYEPCSRGRRNKVSIEHIGISKFVGIQVDGINDNERKLILSDFTVSMNSAKWLAPFNIINNWAVVKTTLRLGKVIVGKCMMGSTSNAMSKGGANYKKIDKDSDVTKRNANGQTKSGLYSLFIPMEWNFEGFIDMYGMPVFRKPEKEVFDCLGNIIDQGVLDFWENEVESLKNDPDALNEFYRQFPRTKSHAFRDESKNSLFNLQKIYEQIDSNNGLETQRIIQKGDFSWLNGVKDTKVIWTPSSRGTFNVSWIPAESQQNNIQIINGQKHPGNAHLGSFGCDSYDISGVVGGGGSNGALHGLTKEHIDDAPTNQFFLEYVDRPQTAEIFFEKVLMALVFYGMPVLAENNKPRLLYHLKNRGYRAFSINRPDKHRNALSPAEKELGGIPSSTGVISIHAEAIEAYIESHVGMTINGTGNMYFSDTLQDWANYDISNRTKFDASVSSGFAIMANHKYVAINTNTSTEIIVNFARYNNKGFLSKKYE